MIPTLVVAMVIIGVLVALLGAAGLLVVVLIRR